MTKKAVSEEEEEVYDIQGLLKYECRDGRDFYLVEWKGYSVKDATWEPRDNFIDPVPEIVDRMETLKREAEQQQQSSSAASSSAATKKGSKTRGPTGTPPPPPAKRSRSTTGAAAAAAPRKKGSKDSAASTTPEEAADEGQQQQPKQQPSAAPEEPPPAKGRGSSGSTAKQPPLCWDEAPAEYTCVRSIRQDAARGICVVLLKDPQDGGPGIKVPIASVRFSHPQAIIDFLLERVQFVDRSTANRAGTSYN